MKNPLLEHPFWGESNPHVMQLVQVLPFWANPFAEDGVIFKVAAATCGKMPFHKAPMAREGILRGVQEGLITPDTTLAEATSGNTGLGMAAICTALGLKFVAVISGDVPSPKLDVMRMLGRNVSIRTPDDGETTVECARRLGAQEGWHNPGQYDGIWNPQSHRDYLAPQLFRRTQVSIFAAPGGTMGTCMGVAQYVRQNDLRTTVVPVMCAEGQEVPATRTLSRVKKDIRLDWQEYFAETDIQFASRFASFAVSFASWRHCSVQLGPSFGLAFVGMLKFLREHKAAGTLDQFRKPDGKIHAVALGPDGCGPYADRYMGGPFYGDKDYAKANLLDLIDLV